MSTVLNIKHFEIDKNTVNILETVYLKIETLSVTIGITGKLATSGKELGCQIDHCN